jgi:hypothetical protein
MKTNIYLAAYKDFSDYSLLRTFCDSITSDMKKEDTTFFVTTGECGDNTCMKYARENGFNIEDWFPDEKFAEYKKECMRSGHWHEFYNTLKAEKNKFVSRADHVVFVWDYDQKNNGIGYGIKLAGKNSKTLSIILPDKKEVHVFTPKKPDTAYVYSLANNKMQFVGTKPKE